MLANKLFIQIIEAKSTDQKLDSSLPIILEYSNFSKENLLLKIKEITNLMVISFQDNGLQCKYNDIDLFIWIPNLIEAPSLFNKEQTAIKVVGLENFNLIKLDQSKTNFYGDDKIKSLVSIVNNIISIDPEQFKQLNFWTIHLSIINWSIYLSRYFKINHFYTNDWKQDVFGFVNYEQKCELKVTNTTDFGFVNYIIKYQQQSRFNEARVIANEILREVLLIGDEPWINLCQKLSLKYNLKKVQDREKITIYVLLEP